MDIELWITLEQYVWLDNDIWKVHDGYRFVDHDGTSAEATSESQEEWPCVHAF